MGSDAGRPRAGGPRLLVAARFLLRSLGLRGATFLLAFLAITVGATMTATMLNLKADLTAKMSKELRRFGPNLILTPRDGAATTLAEDEVRRIPGAAPMLFASGTAALPDGGKEAAATFVGADFEALRRLSPTWRVEGAWPGPEAGTAPGPAPNAPRGLLGAALAGRLGARPGDTVRLRVGAAEIPLRVSGIVSTGEAEDEEVLLPLDRLQEATGLPGRASLAALAIEGGEEAVEKAARSAEAVVAGSAGRPVRPIAAAQGALLAKLDRMMILLTGLILALSGLCLVTTLMSMVVEREAEIGILRSLGAKDAEILEMFIGEVGLLGLCGALAGFGLGAVLARQVGHHLFGAAIEARLDVAPMVVAVSLGLCLLAVLLPLRRALRVQPAAALRGD